MREAIKTVLSIVVLFFALSYYVIGDLTWGYETRWTNPRYIKFRVSGPRNFTEQELTKYDGRDGIIYLAIDGMVFDVTSKPETYGPIGAYHFFTGKDAARAFGTGCFSTDLTYDLRGLDKQTLASVRGWQNYFLNNPKYWHVGYVHHEPPRGPIPPPCAGQQKPA